MRRLVPVLTLILAVGLSSLAPQNRAACEKAGMNWDAHASAPKEKCNSAFAGHDSQDGLPESPSGEVALTCGEGRTA